MCCVFAAVFVMNANAQTIAINEIVSSNVSSIADEDGSYEDWIELYNYGSAAVNLEGYGITDNPESPFKWVFPNVTLNPNSYLMVWASDKNRAVSGSPLHANFKISSGGEPIWLTRADSVLVDSVNLIAIPSNNSYGRQPDGTGAWQIFTTPTPLAANVGSTGVVESPVFSHASGLYKDSFNLTISHSNPNAVIVYTTDGSEPSIDNLSGTNYQYKNAYKLDATDNVGPMLTGTYRSNQYNGAIAVKDISAQPNKLTAMNTRQHPLYLPANPVRKAVVVKARAYVNGVASNVISSTYFVWPQGNPYNIPVISLQIQENYMFDYEIGTYTAGKDFDTWRANNPTNNQWWRPEWNNYWRSGKDWEYPAHVEIFEPKQLTSVVNKNGGFRIHGNNSRTYPIKSLRLYAREEGNFEHDLFDEKVTDAVNPNNKQFRRIMLRGEGTGGSVYYDVVFNRLMQPFFSGVTRIKPAIHFINGEFWGITAMRDRFDEYHYAYHYGINPDNFVAIECGGNNCALDAGSESDYSDYLALRNFIATADLSDNANYAHVDSVLSIESFIDHIILEIFAANDSYERNFWRVKVKENNGFGDGKWRLDIKDFEASFKTSTHSFSRWASTSNSSNEVMLVHLLKNEGFKQQFLNRFADLLNTAFVKERFVDVIEKTREEVAPYLTEDANRFPRENFYLESERQKLLSWANNQQQIQRDTLSTYFNLAGTYKLNLNSTNANAGHVKVNTIAISGQTVGVPQQVYPWNGVYFKGIPITLKAVVRPGYIFTHWSGDVSGTIDSIVINGTKDMNVVANFIQDTVNKQVSYFWVFDNKVDNDVPLTNLNSTYSITGVKAQLEYASCLTGYPFNDQDPNWRKASMERRNAPTTINYRANANNNVLFENANMRGIQIKQPMHKSGLENTVVLHTPTTKMQKVELSFAIESDGAATGVLVEYWNGTKWDTTNMPKASFGIDSVYTLVKADFSEVPSAKHNADFKTRIRFTGTDMEADNGKRVHLNNVALDAIEFIPSSVKQINDNSLPQLVVYPNPANNVLTVESDKRIQTISIVNALGQVVKQINSTTNTEQVTLDNLTPGVYFVKVKWNEGEKNMRIIKN